MNIQNDENRKALPKFLKLILIAGLIGGVLGGLSALAGFWWRSVDAEYIILQILYIVALWGMPLCAAIFLGAGFYQYNRAKKSFALWDNEDEAAISEIEERISWALIFDSLMVILSFFFFSAGTINGLNEDMGLGNLGVIIGEFIAVIFLTVVLQQKCVDLLKQINPEKKGSVYDTKFQKIWFESCDEAEKRQIGQASYKAYSTATKFCPFLWAILFIGNMVFNYGLLPSTVVLIIWGVLQMSYMLEAVKLGKGQNM